ncbi:MAG: peptidyl-prolyl cis-trans isomerase [Candidatus Latescibacteria bacterium]|nr:peptidyl-prolyl cis-trans isomerase [Candidatus Latescibacterota bacterium]
MPTLTKIRRWSKFFLIIVAVAFIAGFLLGELWQILGRRGGRDMLEKGIVGKVGDKTITMQEYNNAFEYFSVKFRTENNVRDLSKQDMERITQQAWQYLIEEKTWSDVLKKSQIKITDPELIEIIQANPPQELRTREDLMTNGEFDLEKYQNYIFAPENRLQLTLYARELIDGLPREKFRIDVINAYRVTDNEVLNARSRENTSITLTYLFFGPKVLSQPYTPGEDEIKAYYEKNKDKYIEEQRYRVRYVFFPLTITSRDSMEVERQVNDIYQYARNEEFTTLIQEFSDTPTDTNARWYKIKDLDEYTRNALSALKDDSITPPFLTFHNWQIVKVDKQTRDSLLLRRISKTIQVTRETEFVLTDSINNFLSQAQSADFDTLSLAYGLFPREMPPWTEERISFPSLYNQYELKDFILSSKPKTISPAYKGRGGYYIFQLTAVEPKKLQPLEQVKSSIEWQLRREKEKELIADYAETVMQRVRAQTPLEQIILNDTLIELHNETYNNFRECRNRKGSQFAGAAYALDPGETYGVLVTDIGSYIIRCDDKRDNQFFDELIYRENRRTEVGNRIFQHAVKQPEVIDYRSADFF